MNKPVPGRRTSPEAALTARIMRKNFMLMGPKLFAALPPWVHALEWEQGAPDHEDILCNHAVIGMLAHNTIHPTQAEIVFKVCNNPADMIHKEFVMWASLALENYKGLAPLCLQFKPQ